MPARPAQSLTAMATARGDPISGHHRGKYHQSSYDAARRRSSNRGECLVTDTNYDPDGRVIKVQQSATVRPSDHQRTYSLTGKLRPPPMRRQHDKFQLRPSRSGLERNGRDGPDNELWL